MNRFCSIFSQLLQLFPRLEFQKLAQETKAECHARDFGCRTQFVSMLFCHLGKAQSLREICGRLASCEGKLSHLGIRIPKRSTLSYPDEHRPRDLYEQVFHCLLDRCRTLIVGQHRKPFRFKNPLVSLDATVIDLCPSLFDWARFQRTKGAVKLHLLLHQGRPCRFRLVEIDDPVQGRLRFLTNLFKLVPATIAAIYNVRWRIELMFKALKQNPKLKTFVGTSPNALKTQIWTAVSEVAVSHR